jgi:hypothetical protein
MASAIERAARAYVSARYELRGAAPASVMEYVARVDEAWHELTIALGDHDPECTGCDEALDGIETGAHYASGRPVKTEREL